MADEDGLVIRRRISFSHQDDQRGESQFKYGIPGPQVDGISSLVALALHNHIPLLTDGFIGNASALKVRAGGGGFATVNVSRLTRDFTGRNFSWYGEEDLQVSPHRPTGQKLAIKIAAMPDEDESNMPLESLTKEIRILGHAALRSHPNIVDIVALGWSGKTHHDPDFHPRIPVLLMEYANCGTLEDFFGLEGVTFDWQLKVGIAYDILHGLEALEDAGVIHGDLKLANILVFRTGRDSFTAKLCDMGSAMIPVDLPLGAPLRQTIFTPPWNSPESSQEIDVDFAYKTDLYSYGLLLCRTFIQGLDPFQIKYQSMQGKSLRSLEAYIGEWKANDCVSDICKFAVRHFGASTVTDQQQAILDTIFDITVRTGIASRADEHIEIKALLRPDLVDSEDERRRTISLHDMLDDSQREMAPGLLEDFLDGPQSETVPGLMEDFLDDSQREIVSHLMQDFSSEAQRQLIPRLFWKGLAESIPSMQKCWQSMLPTNIAASIVQDLRKIASIKLNEINSSALRERVSTAAYELSMFYVQGFGCDMSYQQAGQFLVTGAELGNLRAQNDVIRVLGALGEEIPLRIKTRLVQWTKENAISGSASAMEELRSIYPTLFDEVKESLRTEHILFREDVVGDDIRERYDLRNPSAFLDQIGHTNGLVPFDGNTEAGFTWLHYAAANGVREVVQILVELPDCEIECRTVDDFTPLLIACAVGHSDVAKILINAGADVKAISTAGRTCLHNLQAFEPDEVEQIASLLTAAGAVIAAKANDRSTPLMSACIMKEGPDLIPAVDYLIRQGADPTAIEVSGYSCIEIATMSLDPLLLATLLSSSVFDGEEGAARSGNVRAKALKDLFEIPKFHRFRHGGSRLASKTKETLDLLLTPNDAIAAYAKNSLDSRSPLLDACLYGCTDLIEPLLLHDSLHIDQFSKEIAETGVSLLPLFEAIKHSHTKLVELLVDRCGADVSLVDSANRNVLHLTVEFAPDLFDFFLKRLQDRGCDLQAYVNAGTRKQGFTPLDMAVRSDKFHLAKRLISLGAQYRDFSRLGEAGERCSSLGGCGGSREQMSFFLDMPSADRSSDLVVCTNGFTLFHVTAASLDNALLEQDPSPANNITFLLNNYASRADANRGDDAGSTPLHVAACFGNTAVAQALLKLAEADVNARNRFGRTPLDYLEHRKQGVGLDMKEMWLVDDLEKRNWRDRNQRMEKLLRDHGAVYGRDLVASSGSKKTVV